MDVIFQKIKDDGFRLTKIRKAMVEIFSCQRCLLAPSDILARLSELRIKADRTTIYRELQFLLEKNIIRKIQLLNDKTYYEISSGHHHHLVCIKCHKVKEIAIGRPLEEQEKKIYQKEGFKVVAHSLEFYGLCSSCR